MQHRSVEPSPDGRTNLTGATPDADAGLPDTAMFWRWAGRALRPVTGWILIAAGFLAMLVAYLGVSREALVAKQIPYLISGGIPGMVLTAMGAFFVATGDIRRELHRLDDLERRVAELHAVLLRPAAPADEPLPAGGGEAAASGGVDGGRAAFVAIPRASKYHRPGCTMVAGKQTAAPVDAAAIAQRSLSACPVCEPANT